MKTGYRNIVVLTGAGISQSAGLPTYRGPGGLWTDPELEAMSHIDALDARRHDACSMFWKFRDAIRGVAPSATHRALAQYVPQATIITQNVDGLHQQAGSPNVVEFHGSLARWRCEVCAHESEPPPGDLPRHCDEIMRPAAVLFGELIPPAAEHAAKRALRDCDLFVAVGTSGTVWPAAGFVKSAAYAGARTVLLNLEIDDEARDLFTECREGTADDLVPRFFSGF
jgi:NAD-dependent deacetylase